MNSAFLLNYLESDATLCSAYASEALRKVKWMLYIDDRVFGRQQVRTLEYVKQKGASGSKEFAAIAQKMNLQSRAWYKSSVELNHFID